MLENRKRALFASLPLSEECQDNWRISSFAKASDRFLSNQLSAYVYEIVLNLNGVNHSSFSSGPKVSKLHGSWEGGVMNERNW